MGFSSLDKTQWKTPKIWMSMDGLDTQTYKSTHSHDKSLTYIQEAVLMLLLGQLETEHKVYPLSKFKC